MDNGTQFVKLKSKYDGEFILKKSLIERVEYNENNILLVYLPDDNYFKLENTLDEVWEMLK